MDQHANIEHVGSAPLAAPSSGNGANVAALFTVFVSALSFPLTKVALADLPPLNLAAVRFAVASLLIIPWLVWKRPRLPSRGDAIRFILCGLIGIALYNALLNAGQQTVSASAASFIVNTVPILTALFATLFLDERFNRWGWASAGLGFAGVGIVVAGQPGGFTFGSGPFLIFGSVVAQAAFFVIQKPLVRRYGALASTAYTILAGALMLSPWMAEGLLTLAAPDTAQSTILAVVALAALPAVLGYAAWAHAISQFGAGRSATFLHLIRPTATLLAFVISGETLGVTTLMGGLVAIAGVALVSARGRPARTSSFRCLSK